MKYNLKKIAPPTSQKEEVLYYLIKLFSISREQMMREAFVLNLPDVILRLRYDDVLPIARNDVSVINKFGRKVTYGQYQLIDKEKGIECYNKLQSNGTTKNIHSNE